MSEQRRVSLRDIAKRADVHYTTVSMALRNHPRIPQQTRERLQQLADEMGYRRDPQLAVLSAYRHRGKSRESGTLAVIHPQYPLSPSEARNYSRFWQPAIQRADQLGYVLDHFDLSDMQLTESRLDRILQARGIRGVIVSGRSHQPFELNLHWDKYCAVTFGYALHEPLLPCLTGHQYMNMRLAIRQLHRHGFRRIGFLAEMIGERRLKEQRLGAYFAECATLDMEQALPPLRFEHLPEPDQLREWVRRHKPEVVICRDRDILRSVEQAGLTVPNDIGVAVLNKATGDNSLAGINPHLDVMLSQTIDVVVAALQGGNYGVPANRSYHLVEGSWEDGATVLAKSAEVA